MKTIKYHFTFYISVYQGDGATHKLDAADEGMQPPLCPLFSICEKQTVPCIPSETLASLYLLNVRIMLSVFIPLVLSTVEPL